jgi:hypothetical protein
LVASIIGSTSPETEKVRITNNADVVKGCEFLGNVHAMSGWGSSCIGARNIEETLKERAHKLGANVVYMVDNSGSRQMVGSGTAEAYRCTATAPNQ